MWRQSAKRQVATSIPCESCGQPVEAQRLCREVRIHCPSCGSFFPLEQYISRMDDTLEQFLENVYCDRM